jgi:hypothetical protein
MARADFSGGRIVRRVRRGPRIVGGPRPYRGGTHPHQSFPCRPYRHPSRMPRPLVLPGGGGGAGRRGLLGRWRRRRDRPGPVGDDADPAALAVAGEVALDVDGGARQELGEVGAWRGERMTRWRSTLSPAGSRWVSRRKPTSPSAPTGRGRQATRPMRHALFTAGSQPPSPGPACAGARWRPPR